MRVIGGINVKDFEDSLQMFPVEIWGSALQRQIRQLGRSRRDVRLFHDSPEFESIKEVLNGPAARTNWFTARWGGLGFCLLVSVFLHLLIAYWWNSYGSKLTSQHSISSLTRLSQPGVWYAVRGACVWTVTLKRLTHGQGRRLPGAPRPSGKIYVRVYNGAIKAK